MIEKLNIGGYFARIETTDGLFSHKMWIGHENMAFGNEIIGFQIHGIYTSKESALEAARLTATRWAKDKEVA